MRPQRPPQLPGETRTIPRRSRYVYAIQATTGGPVKIGIADNPHERLEAFQLGCPIPLRVVGAWMYDDPHFMESYIHMRFAEARREREWFDETHPMVAEWLASEEDPGSWLLPRVEEPESPAVEIAPEPDEVGWTGAEYSDCPALAARLHSRILDLQDERDELREMLKIARNFVAIADPDGRSLLKVDALLWPID